MEQPKDGESYMSVTEHFIDSHCSLKRYVLGTLPLEERHIAGNIQQWLKETVNSFDITASKVVAFVHDNASNVAVVDQLRSKATSSSLTG